MKKKTLREVFEFFPAVKWITWDSDSVSLHMTKPTYRDTGNGGDHVWSSNSNKQIDISHKVLQIEWEHRRVCKQRCVKRARVG